MMMMMEGDLSEVGYPPRPLPFPIMAVDIDVEYACEIWRTGKIFRLEEFVASVVETTLLKQDILYALIAPSSSSEESRSTTEKETSSKPKCEFVEDHYHPDPLKSSSTTDEGASPPPSKPESSTDAVDSTSTSAASTSAAYVDAAAAAAPEVACFSISSAAVAAVVDPVSASAAALFPDPTRKLMKLISLQLECSKLQSTLLSMGESIGDPQGRYANHNGAGRKEPLLAVMCGNGYDRAAQAFLEAAAAVEVVIHNEGVRVGQSDLLDAWHLDPDPVAFTSVTSPSRPKAGNLLKSLLEHPSQPRSYRPLHLAALHGRRDFCRLLLHYGADVDGRDKKNRTALYWALKSHNEEMALMLLRHNATVTDREYAMALERLYPSVVEAMIRGTSRDPNVLRVSKRKGKSLFSLGDVISSPMKTVVEAKYKPQRTKDDVKLGDSSEDYLRVALTRMFDDDDDATVQVPPSARQRRRSVSPLVAQDDDLPAAYATNAGIDAVGGGSSDNAVDSACTNCEDEDADDREAFRLKTEILSLLIEAGGGINDADTRRSPLLAAAKKGDERLLEWFRLRGGKMDLLFSNDYYDSVVGNVSRGSTLLHFASHRLIAYLISHGADANVADAEGRAPFYVKAKAGCISSMKQFLQQRHEGDDGPINRVVVDINAQTRKGKTALLVLLVKMASSPRVMDFVASHPFDPNICDDDGWTVLFYAAVLGSVDILKVLRHLGAKADAVDQFGNYPFIYALVAHNFSCASQLVKEFSSSRHPSSPAIAGRNSLPRDWVSPFSSIDNISVITRKVKSVFKGIYKNLYEPVDDADADEEPYLTAPAQPLLHLTLSHGFLHALEDPLNTLFSRPYTSSSRVRAVTNLLQTLLRKGYDPNLKSLRNETALGLLLSMRGWRQGLDVPSTTLLLLQHGADATVLDPRGRNLLDLTLRSNDLENATYVFLAGAPLKPRHRDRIRETVATHDPHVQDGGEKENEPSSAIGCPYSDRQRCLSCVVDSPLSLKATARIVIRRKLGSTSLAPLGETLRQLRLPRELHAYLYLGDVSATTSIGRGSFDWLDEEEEPTEEAPMKGENGKKNVGDESPGGGIDVMEERRNVLEE